MKCTNLANCGASAYFERDPDGERKYVFFGYCADCWKDLEPSQRAILKGEEPPVKEVIHEHHWETPPLPSTKIEVVERVLPAREIIRAVPISHRILLGLWRVAITGVVGWILWRMR